MDAHRLAFPDRTFNAVVGCSVLHDFDWDRALRNVPRVRKPVGWIRFSEPNLANPRIFLQKSVPSLKRLAGDSPDEYAVTARQIERSLATGGFVRVRVEPFEFLHPATPSNSSASSPVSRGRSAERRCGTRLARSSSRHGGRHPADGGTGAPSGPGGRGISSPPPGVDGAMSWSGRRVLVTGAAGFLGSHLCERLAARGAEVTAFVRYGSRADAGNLELVPRGLRDSLRVVRGNVEDAALVEAAVAGQEVVFHLAALIGIPYSYEAPRSYVRTNVDGTLHVLEAARRHGTARVVLTSTSEVYGTALRVPMDEGHPLRAHSPYAATKVAADALGEAYGRSFGVPVAVIRPFNAYGPRQSARAVVPAIVSQALFGPEVRIGARDPVRDLTFVSDLVDAFLVVAESAGTVGRVVNAGSGTGISVGALAREVLSLLGVDRPIVEDPERLRPAGSEVERLVCDAGLLRELTGWAPVTPLRDGLAAVVRFVSENRALYRPEVYAT